MCFYEPEEIFLCFVPLFVAVDALEYCRCFGAYGGMDRKVRQRTIKEALLTAMIVAVGFIYLGKIVFRLMGITENDFMVAGGVLLFAIATSICFAVKKPLEISKASAWFRWASADRGPAVLTTGLMLIDAYGTVPTLAAMTINIVIAGVFF